ncbi:breast cancer metastasis-suppressor 1-like protein [Galendromus occidentalis]|uniref:Breast cancer metastasis-suppressor 1-like protein n=1 Tax=Galendromus occidentalis TaxID=34638 RepID=A0AAJ6QNQ1_9ACAR|nr:breast cancer metastasis-suppressor 1-like protein [Galendromus occidentalis]
MTTHDSTPRSPSENEPGTMTRRGSLFSQSSSDYPTSETAEVSSQTDDGNSSDETEDLDEKFEHKSRRLIEIREEFERLNDVANQLINQQLEQLNRKIQDVRSGEDEEYRALEASLREQHQEKLETACVRLNLRRESVEKQFEALVRANDLQMAEAKARARVELLSEIYKKLSETIANRFSEQLSEVHLFEQISKYVKRFLNDPIDRFEPRSRKKPLTVSFPYIVYNLQDQEVEEDLTEIQQACIPDDHQEEDAMDYESENEDEGPDECLVGSDE